MIGKTWVMYKNTNKGMKSIENSSPPYQTHNNCHLKHETKSGPAIEQEARD